MFVCLVVFVLNDLFVNKGGIIAMEYGSIYPLTIWVPIKIKLILLTIVVVTFSLLLGSFCPHKNNFVNAQELLLLLNHIICSACPTRMTISCFLLLATSWSV